MEYVLHDGSIMKIMKAKELIKIPIWKGNRVIDLKHVEMIQTKIGSDFEKLKKLDNGYKLVSIKEKDASGKELIENYVVDGQHRLKVLQSYYENPLFTDDFNIVVTIKEVKSEIEIINYFNEINFQKPILWKEDPKIIVNMYIEALEKEFNKGKDLMIRPSKTLRPYIFVSDLRDQLLEVVDKLSTEKDDIDNFVRKAKDENDEMLVNGDLILTHLTKDLSTKIVEKAIENKFMLGIYKKFIWIDACLKKKIKIL